MTTGRHLYVHTPYCRAKCPYCDFLCATADRLPPAGRYVDALLRDLADVPGKFETIYIGGGTPTEMPRPELSRLLEALSARRTPDVEWTVEANPKTLSPEIARDLRGAGVTRLSLGVQSAEDRILERLGRIHRQRDSLRAVELAHAEGFPELNGDIIYGLPNENPKNTVEFFSASRMTHVSAYELTIEGNSTWKRQGVDPSVSDDEKFSRFTTIVHLLAEKGWARYEIANFARPGHECRHNRNVWLCGEYAAIGAGACGHENGERYRNTPDIFAYVEAPAREDETAADLAAETLQLILRLTDGADLQELPEANRRALAARTALLDRLRDEGYLRLDGGRVRPTERGLRFLNDAVLAAL